MTSTASYPWGVRPADDFQVGDYVMVGQDSYQYSMGDIVKVTKFGRKGFVCGGRDVVFIRSPLRILTPDELYLVPKGTTLQLVRSVAGIEAGERFVVDHELSGARHLTYALVSLPPVPELDPDAEVLVNEIARQLSTLKSLLGKQKAEASRG